MSTNETAWSISGEIRSWTEGPVPSGAAIHHAGPTQAIGQLLPFHVTLSVCRAATSALTFGVEKVEIGDIRTFAISEFGGCWAVSAQRLLSARADVFDVPS